MTTFGKFDVALGESCSNTPGIEHFTTPCCYSDQEFGDTKCSECGAPIRCEYERVRIAVCTIGEPNEDQD